MAGVLLGFGCSGGDPAADEVRERFAAFETALRAGDEPALVGLVTRESLPALGQVAPGSARQRPRLVVEEVRRRSASCYEVEVREASAGSAAATFALVREGGAWRVDLVESVAVTHEVVDGPMRIEPAGLTAEQIDGIRTNRRSRVQ